MLTGQQIVGNRGEVVYYYREEVSFQPRAFTLSLWQQQEVVAMILSCRWGVLSTNQPISSSIPGLCWSYNSTLPSPQKRGDPITALSNTDWLFSSSRRVCILEVLSPTWGIARIQVRRVPHGCSSSWGLMEQRDTFIQWEAALCWDTHAGPMDTNSGIKCTSISRATEHCCIMPGLSLHRHIQALHSQACSPSVLEALKLIHQLCAIEAS